MRFSILTFLAATAFASPMTKRWQNTLANNVMANGFIQNPTNDQLQAIQTQAHGTIPNIALPQNISATTAVTFQLIATQEILEVAYFTEVLYNISMRVPGYEEASDETIQALLAIVAQEEIHALSVNAILTTAGYQAIKPCQYRFPVNTLVDAIAFAATFTDLVLGTLQTALTSFATDGDKEFIQIIGSVIGQEGAQTGYFRSDAGKIPSETPFLTVGGALFAFSTQAQVIVPGTCPQTIPGLTALPTLRVSPMPVNTQTIRFTYDGQDHQNVSLAYLNQQNVPLVYPITTVDSSNNQITFTTLFTHDQNFLNGLTIAAVVHGPGPFNTASDIAAAAIAGPALIEVN